MPSRWGTDFAQQKKNDLGYIYSMPSKILYVYEERIPEKLRELVRSFFASEKFELDEMTYLSPDEEKIAKLELADFVFLAPGRFISDKILSHAKNVKLMQIWSSGYDKFNVSGAAKFGIPVANNGGANACSVAEHAILLMLAAYKWLPDSHARTVTGNWAGNSHGFDMFLLNGKKIGLIGFGNIGKQVAKKLSGFDVDVVYYDVLKADAEVETSYSARYADFDSLIRESDIISLHLHASDGTKNIIDKSAFSKMKNNAVLINVSRAALVDQDALFEALKTKRIWGAGLDVYKAEPTRPNDPLLTLPNVIATPHMAGSTYDTYAMVMNRALENFRRVARGEKPKWVINGI